ncbi:MAG: prolipoprotein diacylglyceryl transferase family protein, partial [Bacteroidota bacterium]
VLSQDGNFATGIIGAILLAGWKYWDSNKSKLAKPKVETIAVKPSERIADITMVAAISGIIGAKLFAFLESAENFKALLKDPIGQIFSGSGLAIYGGLILAFIVVYRYVKSKGIPPIHVMDSVAPALMVGYGVGRMGCHFSGDGDWGIVNANPTPDWWFLPDSWWSYGYPRNVSNAGSPIEGCPWEHCFEMTPGVYPTPIYEIFMAFVIFGILWALRKRLKVPGALFFVYLILNGIERYWIEKIRVNDIMWMGLTQAEVISIILFIVGIVGLVIVYSRRQTPNTRSQT